MEHEELYQRAESAITTIQYNHLSSSLTSVCRMLHTHEEALIESLVLFATTGGQDEQFMLREMERLLNIVEHRKRVHFALEGAKTLLNRGATNDLSMAVHLAAPFDINPVEEQEAYELLKKWRETHE